MPEIDPNFVCHKLALDLRAKLDAQSKRKLGEKIQKAVAEETFKLLKARFIREVSYTTWLSNVVMVKKDFLQMEDVHRLYRLE